jgi:hypothetical protein
VNFLKKYIEALLLSHCTTSVLLMASTMASSHQAAGNSVELVSLPRSNALVEIASLLSTFHLEKELELPRVQEFSSEIEDECGREIMVSCPCLSLHHGKDGHCGASNHCADRKHAEDHAVCLLARPLKVPKEDEEQEEAEPKFIVARSARALVQNIYSSFAVLVDSRLHAYTDFLARHALALKSKKYASDAAEESFLNDAAVRGIEEKLAMILATRGQVEADTFVTRFELQTEGMALLDGTKSSAVLNFVVDADFAVPRPHGKKEVVSVSFSTTGTITGTCIVFRV